MERKYTFEDYLNVVRTLRSPGGCPWDGKQTHESLRPYMVEEAYEVLDGIRILQQTGQADNLCEELGDVLLQVLFHSVIAEEEGYFRIEDVIDGGCRKMIRRHPHVFPEESGQKTAEKTDWDEIKRREKGYVSPEEELRAIPSEFPALMPPRRYTGRKRKFTEIRIPPKKVRTISVTCLPRFRRQTTEGTANGLLRFCMRYALLQRNTA